MQLSQFGRLFDTIPILVFTVDIKLKFTYFNSTTATILQAEKAPVIEINSAFNSSSVIPCPELISMVNQVISSGNDFSNDIELILPLHKLALDVKASAIFDEDNKIQQVSVIGQEQRGADPAIASVSSAVKSWQTMFSNMEFFVWTYYFQTDTVALTPRCHQFLDLPHDKTTRVPFDQFLSIVHPDDRNLVEKTYRNFMRFPKDLFLEQNYRVRHKNGHYIWIHDKLSLQFDANDQSQYGLGVFEDITDDINKSNSIAKNSNRLGLALDLIGGALWDYNTEDNSFHIDERHQQMLGLTQGKLNSFDQWLELVHPEDREHVLSNNKALSIEKPKISFPHRLLGNDGKYFHAMNLSLATKFDQSGTPALITGVLYDCSSVVNAQESVKQSEERLNLALESANEGVWEYYPEEKRTFRSKSYLDLLGYAESEIENDLKGLSLIHPDDLDKATANLDALLDWKNSSTLEFRMLHKNGHAIFVEFRSKVIDRNHQGKAIRMVGIVEDISHRIAQQKEIEALAYYDPLTGLPNRRLVLERANQALELEFRHRNPVTLMILDLDKFKEINDTMGHEAGDLVLVALSKRFLSCMRSTDTLGRQGGDEFIVVLPACDEDQAYKVAKRIIEQVQVPLTIKGREIKCGVSIGIAKALENGETIDELLRNADIAMYRAKRSHTNIAWFDAQYAQEMNHRIRLEQDLRVAIKEKTLSLNFQPRISLESGEIMSVEALLRWNHHQFGMVSPVVFIPIAEESGLIGDIGHYLIQNVCEQLNQWQKEGIYTTVSINTSPEELTNPLYPENLLNLLDKYELPRQAIEIEITETAAISNWEKVIITLNKLDQAGIVISLDDWGTGYSSLSYLTQIPAHYVKLDRTFIKNLDNPDPKKNTHLILKGMTGLTQSLGFELVAEGIETAEQARSVKELGCKQGQGYFFSPPIGATEITTLLKLKNIPISF